MKNNVKNIIPFIAALAALIIALPLRVYQYFTQIEPGTGFYINKNNPSVFILYALVFLAAGFSLVYAALKKKDCTPTPISSKSLPFALVSFVSAAGIAADSVKCMSAYFDMFSAEITSGQTVKQYISMQGGNILLIQALLGICAAVYFLLSGVLVGLGNASSSKLKVPALMPVLWSIFRLLYRFKRTISFTNVSDLFLELFMIAFSMMFFFACAQVNSKIDHVNDEKSVVRSEFWKVSGYGIPAFIFASVCFIPRFAVTLAGKSDVLPSMYTPCPADLAILIFSAYTTITALKARTPVSDNSGE